MFVIPFTTLNKFNKKIKHFGQKSRSETITDVVFVSDNLIICANLSDKTLILVQIDFHNQTSKIVHTLDIPHHPDLIEIVNNTIYVVNLNHYLTVCRIVDMKLILTNNIYMKEGYMYHGVCVNPNQKDELFLASTRAFKFMTRYDVKTRVMKDFIIPRLEDAFLKDLIFIDNKYVLIIGSDNGPKSDSITYKSYLNLYTYENETFTFLDGLTYINCHMDAVVFCKGKYYVTAQLNDNGYILNGSIENNYLIPGPDQATYDFPHGLAISKSKKYIAHSCYSTGSVYIDTITSGVQDSNFPGPIENERA